MAAKKKKTGIYERAARKVAYDTAGARPGIGTTLRRGTAMLGALVGSAFAPGRTRSNTEIKQKRTDVRATEAKAQGKAKKKASKIAAGKRKPIEKGTGTAELKRRLEGVNELAKAGKKDK